jgi:uncharacterized protein (TIGR00297 family)
MDLAVWLRELFMDLLMLVEALVACGIIGAASLRFRFVTLSGFFAALIIGVVVFAAPSDGWKWFIVIMIFHVVAAQFTKYKYHTKRLLGFAQEKGGARAWQNVTANGGIAGLLALGEGLWPSGILAFGFIGAVATATADTLATEIGLLSKREPRLITDLRRKVSAGTSGGVSPIGELAALLGAVIIGFSAWSLGLDDLGIYGFKTTALVALLSGLAGCTLDSVVGATVQGMFSCPICGAITENKRHCGSPTKLVRGSSLIDNNMVNFIATAAGALVGIAVFNISMYL